MKTLLLRAAVFAMLISLIAPLQGLVQGEAPRIKAKPVIEAGSDDAREVSGRDEAAPKSRFQGSRHETPVRETPSKPASEVTIPSRDTDQGFIPKKVIVEKLKKEKQVSFTSNAILFQYGSDEVLDQSFPQVKELAAALQDPQLKAIALFFVDGHTCDIGTEENNCRLSWRRARAIIKILSEGAAIPANKLVPRGFGERRPAYANASEEDRAKNRRVVVKVGDGKDQDKALVCSE